jgi:hypothetical protein
MSATTSIRKRTQSDFTLSYITTKYRFTRKSQEVSGKIYADVVLEAGVNIRINLLEVKGDLEAVITAIAHYKCNTCPRKIKMES